MPQQSQPASQYVFGPANTNGDVLHIINSSNQIVSWEDRNALTNGVSGVTTAQNGPAANLAIGGAAAAFVVANAAGAQLAVSLPGNGAYDCVPFIVHAAGYISAAAGTYTVTLQPLLYASTTPGFTAVAANAIFSAGAVTCTMTQTAASLIPFSLEAHLIGSNAAGTVYGYTIGTLPTTSSNTALAAPTNSAATAILNPPSSVTFTASVPLQFSFGITTVGTASAGSILGNLSLYIES